jgi:uncharacterized membrane protein
LNILRPPFHRKRAVWAIIHLLLETFMELELFSCAFFSALLAIILIVGLFVFIVDAADRAYWDKQGA